MPVCEAPSVELGNVPEAPSVVVSPSPSEISSASSPEPPHISPSPLFRALAMPPPDPEQPPGQEELERRLPGYRRIVIPRELTLIELLKQSSGVITDEEVLRIREAKLRVVAERVGLRRLHVLAPRLRSLTLDGSALSSLRDLGIGLVHLKILSVNRCGLSSLDGVWGLGVLRELHASGNRIQDLQPLAALQKLHTLNLSDDPISETRLWTLGACGALRRLSLRGTPAAACPGHRARVASLLPMLVYLDDLPLHRDIEYDSDGIIDAGSSSDSGDSDAEANGTLTKIQPVCPEDIAPGPSSSNENCGTFSVKDIGNGQKESSVNASRLTRRRPATTECVGTRPPRPHLPPRPHTAVERKDPEQFTRLQILNTLMDEEWRCSGSKLTSQGAVCGNLARALRRPKSSLTKEFELEKEMVERAMQEATRAIAAEIPRAPGLGDWAKFKEETGIDIDIDFNERARDVDPVKAIERLEKIENETMERLKNGKALTTADLHLPNAAATFASCSMSLINENDFLPVNGDVFSFNDFISPVIDSKDDESIGE